uniref:Uncharacterized protein n=1 Tax=Anopheles dirus TaxID=7168 RepID=A0A182N2J6_9DIPT
MNLNSSTALNDNNNKPLSWKGSRRSTSAPDDRAGSVRWAPLEPPPIEATWMLSMASAERSGTWSWCGRLSALDHPSVLRARAVTNQPGAVVVVVVIVRDRDLTGDLLHDLIVPQPLDFAGRWVAVVQADQLDVLTDGGVDPWRSDILVVQRLLTRYDQLIVGVGCPPAEQNRINLRSF